MAVVHVCQRGQIWGTLAHGSILLQRNSLQPAAAYGNLTVATMTKKCISAVGEEIHQTKAFATIEEELLVSLLRTTDVLQERFEQVMRPFNISMTQYNVLRILRGAEPDGPHLQRDRRAHDRPRARRHPSAGAHGESRTHQAHPRQAKTAAWWSPASPPAGLKLLDKMEPEAARDRRTAEADGRAPD